ncbi:MAG: hypothetical protein ACKVX9_20680 [Blastocatellia bacterium]
MKMRLPQKWILAVFCLTFVVAALIFLATREVAMSEEALRAKILFEKSEEAEGEGGRREEWLYQQRAYPAGRIPADAGVRMVEQLEREEARMRSDRQWAARMAADPAQQAVWAALGPQPILAGRTLGTPRNNVSGRISAIALDPRYNGTTNQTIYLGGAQGGVWKSTDNGANWAPLTDGQPSVAIGAIAVDPRNPETIYAGTGDGTRCALCYYGAGLLKSLDGGATWSVIPGPIAIRDPRIPAFINAAFTRIAVDPSNSSTIYAATTFGVTAASTSEPLQLSLGQVGLWKSTDGGSNWRNLDPGATDGTFTVHDVIVDPRNPSRVIAGMRTIGIYRSEQGGEPGTWQRLTAGLPDLGADPQATSPYRRVALASGPPIAPSTNTTLYAAFARTNSQLLGIFRSTDNGGNWTQVTTPQVSGQANYNLDITVDPNDGNVVYYGTSTNDANNGGTLWRSRDAGQTWSDISRGNNVTGGLHVDTHQIATAPAIGDLLFTGNDGGIWRTDAAKADPVAWTQLNDTLNLSQFMSIAVHPTDPNIVIGGTQDNGTNRFRGNVAWDHIADGDGGYTLIDQSNPQVMYHTFFNQNSSGSGGAVIGPEVSFNGGNSWSLRGCFSCNTAQGNFNPADRVAFYAPMAVHAGFGGASGNVVYFGTYRLYRTPDRGVTWTGLGAGGDGFGADLTKGEGVISAIAAHTQLADGEVVWVGTSDGLVQVTANAGANAGATFTNVTKTPLPNRYLSDIAADPGNTQRAVIVYSGFNTNTPPTPGHVFLTNNRGGAWLDISGNLPDVPVTSVAMNPSNPANLFLGTDLGVFQTTNGGTTWERLGNGMPRVATFMVRYQAATGSLFAATHGRGVYRLTTSRAVTTVSAANFSASSIASEAIVAAFGTGLATQTIGATIVPLPTTLGGSRVAVRDSAGVERLSPLFFVSPQQINFQIPPGTASGAASVGITSNDGIVSIGAAQIAATSPSLFAQNANGRGVPAGFALRVRSNGAQENVPISALNAPQNQFIPAPIDLGPATDQVFLVLFGTGVRFRSALSNVSATIGGVNAPVQFAGAQGALVGLDQINLGIARGLIGRGEVDVILIVDGKPANTLRINVR